MSTLAIVVIAVAAVLLILFLGGLVASRRRASAPDYARHVAEADAALESARAADKGWDRSLLDSAARDALARERPDGRYEDLHLVLVDDRPGMTEDRAHYVAVGPDGECRLTLTRTAGGDWMLERLE